MLGEYKNWHLMDEIIAEVLADAHNDQFSTSLNLANACHICRSTSEVVSFRLLSDFYSHNLEQLHHTICFL